MSGTPRIASPGTPPLIWSSVEEAFRNINQNFNDLYATIQADGSTQVVNFSQLYDDVSPAVDAAYKLGDFDKSWKSLNLSPYLEIDGSNLNGLWLGLAHIVDDGTSAVLPPDSRVGLDLIIDPAKTFWKTFSIDSENFVEAADFADTLNINSGTAIQIVVDSSAESLTFNNTGVTSLIAGTGTSISSSTGNITVTNTGVITLTNGTTLPAGLPAGSGISVSGSTGNISITNTGILDVQNGVGITVSKDIATGIVTVSNSAPAQVAYRTVRVSGSSDLVADSTSDTLVIEAGYGMVITTTEIIDDTLVLAVDQNIDIMGSVFANDSSIIVDSIDQKIYASGGITGNLTGDTTGYHTGDMTGSVFADNSTKLVDAVDGLIVGDVNNDTVTTYFVNFAGTGCQVFVDEGGYFYLRATPDDSDIIIRTNASGAGENDFVFGKDGNFTLDGNIIGDLTGYHIGDMTGSVFGQDSSILVDAVDSKIIGIVETTSVTTANLFVTTVDTTDSTAITVVPPVNFNTDVNFENELFIQNSRVMAIAELKTIVAASINFADFQARIAAL